MSDIRGNGTGADSVLVLVLRSHVSALKCDFPFKHEYKRVNGLCDIEGGPGAVSVNVFTFSFSEHLETLLL